MCNYFNLNDFKGWQDSVENTWNNYISQSQAMLSSHCPTDWPYFEYCSAATKNTPVWICYT